jgi:hypothetical protein
MEQGWTTKKTRWNFIKKTRNNHGDGWCIISSSKKLLQTLLPSLLPLTSEKKRCHFPHSLDFLPVAPPAWQHVKSACDDSTTFFHTNSTIQPPLPAVAPSDSIPSEYNDAACRGMSDSYPAVE